MQLGKKKLWVLACPKCQEEKAAGAPPAGPPAVPASGTPSPTPAPASEKKTEFQRGWFISRRVKA